MACPHGEHESYCIDCLEGPPAKVEPNKLQGQTSMNARHSSRCARKNCTIEPGDAIVFVNDLQGWCCSNCAHA